MANRNYSDDDFEEFWDGPVPSAKKKGVQQNTQNTKDSAKNTKSANKDKPKKSKVVKVDDNAYGNPPQARKPEERDYRPVRQRRDSRSGFLGGFMYFVFVLSVSVILACLAWLAASDVLALNKEDLTAEVEIPEDIFTPGTLETENEDGSITTEDVEYADIDAVATILKDAGIIEYKPLFKLFAKISNADYKIDPGTYSLSTQFDYRAIVKKMQFGSDSAVRVSITFPEGFNIHQIFQRLEENKICTYTDLIECAANYEFSTERYSFLEGIPYGDPSRLEGFLFPDTYEFYQGMTPQAAIDTFLQIFKARITAEMLDWIAASGYSYRDIINIASMIEKETSGSMEDRQNIASVIYNRLAAGMALGVDATSIYSHYDYDGDYTEMIDTWVADSSDPYNTRVNPGLPPSPIANPGIESITAALKYEKTDYYYYALDSATGEHRFFTNSTDHQNFVATQNYS